MSKQCSKERTETRRGGETKKDQIELENYTEESLISAGVYSRGRGRDGGYRLGYSAESDQGRAQRRGRN